MTSNSEKNKRARAPNISEEEKSIILLCISKEKDIIECKKTDKFSNRDKNSAWERIAVNFNTHLGANKRDSKCLRRFWEVEKAKSRKEFARERKEHMETGGGPEKESFNDSTLEINEIIVRPQIVELTNRYDSNGIPLEQSGNLTQEITSIAQTQDLFSLNDIIMHSDIVLNVNAPITDDTVPTTEKEFGSCFNVVNLSEGAINYDANVVNVVHEDNYNSFNPHTSSTIQKSPLKNVPSTSNLTKKSTKRMVSEEANLRIKKLKSTYESESTLYKLQIDYQKLLIEGLKAKRAEENELFKLKKDKLLLKICKLKDQNQTF